ncbi:hypothetical protein QUW29_03675, partial [Limosilactobacillus vaginalis]|uniref:hypothetical protein n=1 Tax=Limosilactobacillus vaginalis TaxID=1633 RepID=UPI0025A46DFC
YGSQAYYLAFFILSNSAGSTSGSVDQGIFALHCKIGLKESFKGDSFLAYLSLYFCWLKNRTF